MAWLTSGTGRLIPPGYPDAIVLIANGMPLSECVVSRAVASAVEDLADRQVFAVSEEAWEELLEVLERPATAKPKIAELRAEHSAVESG